MVERVICCCSPRLTPRLFFKELFSRFFRVFFRIMYCFFVAVCCDTQEYTYLQETLWLTNKSYFLALLGLSHIVIGSAEPKKTMINTQPMIMVLLKQ